MFKKLVDIIFISLIIFAAFMLYQFKTFNWIGGALMIAGLLFNWYLYRKVK
ncbi:hypothetical protein [Tetragenococcus koreensis]|uniref:Uncharacterized protein n=1 Tax=Tetragenococcus koreensis TaxID=290335 RepID=A0AAN4UAW5_9ENTE|nr:hypothetical protein [Tetragenococcus koreensis]MCF1631084.1 hypothetical protein [Tetragenococcus koreensis]GEN90832.1 hypothetical protein TKO01_08780 [Tetragenococcus koreensis]GEQ48705.1 hypothetical protein TK11N_05570 [Tetragenococcus koreensis]GEQ51134.1 hypothetical protein TK12N_04780 [Tetragenococcus koreensis]GEQ53713.1 hypothetical protein TK2N_05570 [Tetragenococcus koreensis]